MSQSNRSNKVSDPDSEHSDSVVNLHDQYEGQDRSQVSRIHPQRTMTNQNIKSPNQSQFENAQNQSHYSVNRQVGKYSTFQRQLNAENDILEQEKSQLEIQRQEEDKIEYGEPDQPDSERSNHGFGDSKNNNAEGGPVSQGSYRQRWTEKIGEKAIVVEDIDMKEQQDLSFVDKPDEVRGEAALSKQLIMVMTRELSRSHLLNDDEVAPKEEDLHKADNFQSRSNLEWPKDALDNNLSYSKMMDVVHQRHPRRNDNKPYQIWGTSTGWYCLCRRTQSDIKEMGVGISVYFKMLKFLTFLYLWFALLSIPAYFFYYTGNETKNQDISLKYALSAFSLGNIGSTDSACNYLDFSQYATLNTTLICSYGTFESLTAYTLGTDDTQCMTSITDDEMKQDNECNMQEFTEANKKKLMSTFDQCKGLTECTFTHDPSLFSNQCQLQMDYRNITQNSHLSNLTYSGLASPSPIYTGPTTIYIQALCSQAVLEIPLTGKTMQRTMLGLLVVCLDVAIIISFIIAIYFLDYFEKDEEKYIDKSTLTPSDFTVQVKNLPRKADYHSVEQLKAILWNHLEVILEDVPQQLKHSKVQFVNVNQLVSIHFGLTDYGKMHFLINIGKQLKQRFLTNLRMKLINVEKTKVQLKKKIDKIDLAIDKQVLQLKKYEEKNQSEVVNAFVTFRSMEGKERAIQAYSTSKCRRCCLTNFCCQGKRFRKKLLMEKNWLKVKRANAPELIMWENLTVGKFSRFLRILFTALITLILICGTFYITIVEKNREKELKQYSPQINCPSDVTMEMAFQDQQRDEGDRVGFMHCYCMDGLLSGNLKFTKEVFSNGETYCKGWLKKYLTSNSFVYIVPICIMIINIIIKALLRKLSEFERAHSKTQEIFSSMFKMFVVSFLNTGLIILCVNLNFGITVPNFPIFAGEYREFSVEWYRSIGSTIVMTMILNIFSPHLSNAIFQLMRSVSRCRDRKCSCNAKKTKQVLQSDYEDMNTGGEFLMEFRYSQVLTNLWIIMMYSSGMPLLYIVAAASFFVTYWVDKFLLLRCYKKPPPHGLDLSRQTRSLIKFSIIFHFVIGFFMFSNSTILMTKDFSKTNSFFDKVSVTGSAYFNSKRLYSIHSIIFLASFILCLLVFFLRNTLVRIFVIMFSCCKKLTTKFSSEEQVSDDFYQELKISQLKHEYNKTKTEKTDYEQKEKYGHFRQNEKFNGEIVKYKNAIGTKIKVIEAQFAEIAQNAGLKVNKEDIKSIIEEVIGKIHSIKREQRMKGQMYSYDLKDTELLSGVREVEKYLELREKITKSEQRKKEETEQREEKEERKSNNLI